MPSTTRPERLRWDARLRPGGGFDVSPIEEQAVRALASTNGGLGVVEPCGGGSQTVESLRSLLLEKGSGEGLAGFLPRP